MDQRKYVVITLDSNGMYKIPLSEVGEHLATKMSLSGSVDFEEALKQVGESADLVVASWVYCIDWADPFFRKASQIKPGIPGAPVPMNMNSMRVDVMTESEIDRFLTQTI